MKTTFLSIVSGAQNKKYTLKAYPVTIGSGAGNAINLPDSSVAQDNCHIKCVNDKYILKNISPLDNVFVNGAGVLSQPLTSGDRIQIGDVVLKFEISEHEYVPNIAVGAKIGSAPRSPKSGVAPEPPSKTSNGLLPRRLNGQATPKAATSVPFTSKNAAAGNLVVPQRSALGNSKSNGVDKKQLIVFGIVIAVIAVILVFLFVIKGNSGPNPELVAKDLTQAFNKINDLTKESRWIEADEALEKVISDTKYVNTSAIAKIKQLHNQVHDAAKQEKDAVVAVTQFKEKMDKVAQDNEIAKQAEQLFDECKTLINRYSTSSQSAQLQQFKTELEKVMAERKPLNWTEEFDKIKKDVAHLLAKNSYSEAVTLLDNFKSNYESDTILASGIASQKNAINKKAQSELRQIKDNVSSYNAAGKTADAINLLNEAIERFKGTDCQNELVKLKEQSKQKIKIG